MKELTDLDILNISLKEGLDPVRVKTIARIEGAGRGFYMRGAHKDTLLLRFEGHRFRKYTKAQYDVTHPTLSYRDYRLGNKYNRGLDEPARFAQAARLDENAAIMSTSWGMFQIMGDEYWRLGYNTPRAMVDSFDMGEIRHLDGFIAFCKSKKILEAMKPLATIEDVQEFFLKYNGPSYLKNGYVQKWDSLYPKTEIRI